MVKKIFALILFSGMFLYSCGSGGPANEIQIDGSSTVFPLTEAVAEEYRSEAPNVRVTVGRSGTGGGFQKFIRGDIDINNASREIQESEAKVAEKNGIEYLELSVAYDGLSVVVHPDNDWVDYLTVEELKKIWEPEAQGEIMNWNDVREEWPDRPLNLYGAGTASGTFDYFTEAIVGESGASRGDFTASEDDNVLVQGVSTDQNALGFFGLAYYEENSDKLKLVPVKDGDKEPVTPTIEAVANNRYTPLSRPLFIYVTKEAAQRPATQDFVKFYLETAPKVTKQVGYVAMPDSVYQVQKNKFEAFYAQPDTATSSAE
ncbi:PstS family phosphate ABC transporter substrate-binding protein [Fodinibius sp.]|uniref:PstS family phosphate ABC transporter substrate-binding protein n=1 Tax=Fodinibius sp. TaxID=1872440 RepID=UPI002ACE81D6|nr:PstS family phosphate ABC transporter substrate-binding protein [Fodinibius sp.]MDZ7660108.1 PstS family phosphate ABC transporter substrate-binding protein [Fodinibius sp.]